MNEENNMDLLDLDVDDGASMDALPDATPFASPRPRKPWLLLGVGLLIIVLATYIIVRTVGGDSSTSMDVDLDAPAVVVDGGDAVGGDVNPNPMPDTGVVLTNETETVQVAAPVEPVAPAQPVAVQAEPVSQPVAEPVQENAGMPVRVVADRTEATFNPDKQVTASKPAAKKTTNSGQKKAAPKPVVAPKGSWYVQFGSYSSHALAEAAQRKMTRAHSGLFQGKQFVILAAVLPNGNTVYRLRVAFSSSVEANGFCRNAKSDGLDCYVAK